MPPPHDSDLIPISLCGVSTVGNHLVGEADVFVEAWTSSAIAFWHKLYIYFVWLYVFRLLL